MIDLAAMSRQCRRRILQMAFKVGGGHIGGSFSVLEILLALYAGPAHPSLPQPARVILSKGHSCLALYTVLYEFGIIPEEALADYCVNGGLLHGHPHRGVPGIEISAGSLGHGPSVAVGMALADKMAGLDRQTFCVLGDGECNEGSVWEALLMGAQQKLGNLTFIIDANRMESLDFTQNILGIYPLMPKLKMFGWEAECVDGHDLEALMALFAQRGRVDAKRPVAIVANTVKGEGVSFMENSAQWHYRAPSEEELELARKEIGE